MPKHFFVRQLLEEYLQDGPNLGVSLRDGPKPDTRPNPEDPPDIADLKRKIEMRMSMGPEGN